MYNTVEELEQGINFSIVELNGAASEPHIFMTLNIHCFFAWKELARHITYMYEISVTNHKMALIYRMDGMKEYRMHLVQSNKIVNFKIMKI
jgi:hypothetical protein